MRFESWVMQVCIIYQKIIPRQYIFHRLVDCNIFLLFLIFYNIFIFEN
jgi:hypothetical protein